MRRADMQRPRFRQCERAGVRLGPAGALGIALMAVACAQAPEQEEAARVQVPPPRHIFLVSIDTLRADHLGAYGYELPTSPNLDEFRRDAVLFEHVIAQAPSTLPSHASIFTSLTPEHHGAFYAERHALPDSAITVTEVLKEGGFHTMAFTGAGQLDARFGLSQGFDEYHVIRNNQWLEDVARQALDWLGENPDDPAFLFLHTYQTHHPYKPTPEDLALFEHDYEGDLPPQISVNLLKRLNRTEEPVAEADVRHIMHTYDAEIREMDAAFGRFVDELRRAGLYDDSMIVFTSDHGEEFGEHGRVGWHAHTLYDELLRVPLMIKLPGSAFAGVAVSAQVRSLDIAPTILDIAGLPVPEQFSGRTLMPLARGEESGSRPAVSTIDAKAGARYTSYREPAWKLIGKSLYDLADDPGETQDVSREHRPETRRLYESLTEDMKSRTPLTASATELDEEALEELRALGYVD